ncbi:uncharacterized protein EDB91DRAFT_1222103 [Suillus paluster]|uniref:uncharacterized protein n=1 Tax=Suillus paluster TaxID=48578 RepID=UPI001B864F9A|nr:uncharacterized protein EDB91DRAFT_1222103 [Suillus paluster]KAG1741785.1 hypothetical protein EDB91DRAFT_1222103 [Suillus paluster]
MSATSRSEARRKAILNRGTDRLKKLTSSARGEDAPYLNADNSPRGATASFVGEEPTMPPSDMPPPYSFGDVGLGGAAPNPSVWSEEQQSQFLQALMGGAANAPPFPQPQISAAASNGATAPSPDDPLAAIMNSLQQMDPSRGGAAGKVPAPLAPAKPPSIVQKFTPLLHILCAWCILAFFVLFKEPQTFVERSGGVSDTFWKRWAELAWRSSSIEGWGVQFVPFMWAFMTVQVMLHSIRIFMGNNQVRPPTLLALALPHLPPPFPSIITNGLRYIQMGGAILDDLSAIVFGIGMVILIAGWFAG